MKSGDVVTIAATGDDRNPQPAPFVQTGTLPTNHACVIVCPPTSELVDAAHLRITVDPPRATACACDLRSSQTSSRPPAVNELIDESGVEQAGAV